MESRSKSILGKSLNREVYRNLFFEDSSEFNLSSTIENLLESRLDTTRTTQICDPLDDFLWVGGDE